MLLAIVGACLVYWPILLGEVPYPAHAYHLFPVANSIRADAEGFPRHAELGDALTQSFPWRIQAAKSLRQGSLPQWNPYLLSGAPFLANLTSSVLYPPHLLLSFLPGLACWTLRSPLRFLIAFLGAAACARELGACRAGAALAGGAFACSGFMIAYQTWSQADSAAWMPLALGALLKLRRTGSAPAFVALATASACVVLGGHPEIALFVGLVLALATVTLLSERPGRGPSRSNFAILSLFAAVLALLLSAPQTLPSASWIGGLARGLDNVDDRSLSGFDLVALISRDVSKNPNDLGLLVPRSAAYVGIGCLILFPVGFLARRARAKGFLAIVALGSALVVYGAPGVHEIMLATPVLQAVPRFRMLVLLDLALALLAALGLDELLRARTRAKRRRCLLGAAFGTLIAATLWIAAACQHESLAISLRRGAEGLSVAGILIVLVSLLVALFLRARTPRLRTMLIGFGGVLVAADLLTFAGSHLPYVRKELVAPEPAAVGFLKRQVGLFRATAVDSSAPQNLLAYFGLRDPGGYDYVARNYAEFLHELGGVGRRARRALPRPLSARRIARRENRLLDLLNVRYLVSTRLNESTAELERSPERFKAVYDDGSVQIFENGTALPRAWVVAARDAREVAEGETTLAHLRDSRFDPRRDLIVEAGAGYPQATDRPCSERDDPSVRELGADYAIELALPVDCRAILVVSESYDPGWRAWVDGKRATVLRVNHALTGIPLAVGSRDVVLRYRAPGLRLGIFCSVLAMLVLGGISVRYRGGGIVGSRLGSGLGSVTR